MSSALKFKLLIVSSANLLINDWSPISRSGEECINHGTFRLGYVVTVAQVAQHPTVQMTRKENKTFPSIDDFPKRSRVFTY